MTTSLADSLPGHSARQWAQDFLKSIGAPTSPGNVQVIENWEMAESGQGGGLYNPLNSTELAPGSTPLPGNGAGVQDYVSYQQGIQAAHATYTQTQWAGVVNALKANKPDEAAGAIEAETRKWAPTFTLPGAQIDPNTGNPVGSPMATTPDPSSTSSSSSTFYGCPEGKIWDGPSIGGQRIYLTKCEGRAFLGAFSMGAGVVIFGLGLGMVALSGRAGQVVTGLVRGAV